MAKKEKDANYDYKNVAPKRRMGQGSYANLPDAPIFATFSDQCDYRGGIKNGFVQSVDLLSKVDENMKEQYGHD